MNEGTEIRAAGLPSDPLGSTTRMQPMANADKGCSELQHESVARTAEDDLAPLHRHLKWLIVLDVVPIRTWEVKDCNYDERYATSPASSFGNNVSRICATFRNRRQLGRNPK
jgi:hypothetical protein